MRLCIYEDGQSAFLEPIALTRPAFALWCGAQRLFERHVRQWAPGEVGFWMRPVLAQVWKFDQPGNPVNDADWARAGATLWVNGRWLPGRDVRIDATTPHVGVIRDHIAYAVVPAGEVPCETGLDAWLTSLQKSLPSFTVNGVILDYLWDFNEHNGAALKQDVEWFRAANTGRPTPSIAITGPQDQLVVAKGATIDPFVFADTRGGPVLIDRDAVVHSFTRLEGPCYVGKESWIAGAKLRAGCTIGPCSRIGGEVEASIVQGYSNKVHDGFLGHSYIGEWVNLAAATQTSDLRNDYGPVSVTVNGARVATGKNKVGAFIGDHSKTGLSALLNTGSTIGCFANLLPSGSLLPQVVPPFCQVQHGELRELWDLRKVFSTAARVMQRRSKTMTEAHKDSYYDLFEATANLRKKTIRETEIRQLKRSV